VISPELRLRLRKAKLGAIRCQLKEAKTDEKAAMKKLKAAMKKLKAVQAVATKARFEVGRLQDVIEKLQKTITDESGKSGPVFKVNGHRLVLTSCIAKGYGGPIKACLLYFREVGEGLTWLFQIQTNSTEQDSPIRKEDLPELRDFLWDVKNRKLREAARDSATLLVRWGHVESTPEILAYIHDNMLKGAWG
jgi:hypothetical protein